MSEANRGEEHRKEWTLTVLTLIHGRHNCWLEIQRLTDEIAQALDRNDRVSTQMLLEMRGEEIDRLEENMRQVQLFRSQMPEEIQGEIDRLLEGQTDEARDTTCGRIADTVKNCRKLVEEVVAADQRMSKRIAGADSFYK